MADKPIPKPAEPPKPVHIGGESLIERILPHIKKVIIGVVVIAVVVTMVFGWRAWKQRQESNETEKLAVILELGMRPVAPPNAPPRDPKSTEPPTFASEKERAEKLLDEIVKQGTEAAGPTYRAALLMDAGKIDEAITEYRKCTVGDHVEALLCREGLGIAIETKAEAEKDAKARQAGLEEALTAFLAMQPAADGPRRAYALYHQARIKLQLGKTPEAKALFLKAKEMTPPKELTELIERRLTNLGAA